MTYYKLPPLLSILLSLPPSLPASNHFLLMQMVHLHLLFLLHLYTHCDVLSPSLTPTTPPPPSAFC